ncbi:MAG: hypothetical protein NFCOHLIN_00618 [Gammaproteobacteria bacterium]|nr:hypothetical protein [Gammaproteobacteria bacterium]
MKMQPWSLVGFAFIAMVLSVSAVLAGGQADAESGAQTTGGAESAQPADTQAEAMGRLMDMAKFLSQTQRFSVNIRAGYDVLQESGQKIEFGEKRTVTVSRPDRVRIDAEQSDGDRHTVLLDGKDITVFNATQNVYATTPKPGTIDEAIAYFRRDLHMRLPLAALIVNQLPGEFERRVQSIDYVEQTDILGVPAHHLAARTAAVDFQVWVADGDQPLPLRVVLTYRNEEGQPQFWAQLSDWNVSPVITDATFAFTPPDGARKIAFLAQMPRVAAPETQGAEPTGAQQ